MRRAKIVCTLGPATESPESIKSVVEAGMDVARINRSHGDPETHKQMVLEVRKAAKNAGRNVAILIDLQGPKIRLGTFKNGKERLEVGDTFTITTEDVVGTKSICSTTHRGLPGDTKVGDSILVDDGKVLLKVTAVDDTKVTTVCEIPGPISDHKGLNLPGAAVSVPAMSEKDEEDLRWGLRNKADFIALSFVRTARDVDRVRAIMYEEGRLIPVIAKIEKPQAVENLAEIVEAFDGFMVARGDLGVELPLEQVPLVQKRIIEMARRNAKPVIVATQMLDSMTSIPRPTRAEVSDVANAVLDGADAVMLSGETSVGAYPALTVSTMGRIVEFTETAGRDRIAPLGTIPHTIGGAITNAAAQLADVLKVRYVATFSQTGDSAKRMSRLRPDVPLLAFTPLPEVYAQLALSWGTDARLVDSVESSDQMVQLVDDALQASGEAVVGDYVIVVSGAPPNIQGTTNDIRLHRIGDDAITGQ